MSVQPPSALALTYCLMPVYASSTFTLTKKLGPAFLRAPAFLNLMTLPNLGRIFLSFAEASMQSLV